MAHHSRDVAIAGRTIYSHDWERTEAERKVCKVLEEVAQEVGAKSIQAGKPLFHWRWPLQCGL